MTAGISLFLLAVGAVLAFAVDYQANGIDIAAVGWILIAVGFLGLMMHLLFLASFAPFYRESARTEVVERPTTTHTHLQ